MGRSNHKPLPHRGSIPPVVIPESAPDRVAASFAQLLPHQPFLCELCTAEPATGADTERKKGVGLSKDSAIPPNGQNRQPSQSRIIFAEMNLFRVWEHPK